MFTTTSIVLWENTVCAMSRMTRKKAAEAAEQLHIDEDVLLELPSDEITLAAKAKAGTPDTRDRLPLGEIAPNSADSKSQSDDGAQESKKSVGGKKGAKKGGAKGKKNNFGASTASQDDVRAIEDAQEVLPDENDSAPSPASEKAAEDLMKDVPECKYCSCRNMGPSILHNANAGVHSVNFKLSSRFKTKESTKSCCEADKKPAESAKGGTCTRAKESCGRHWTRATYDEGRNHTQPDCS